MKRAVIVLMGMSLVAGSIANAAADKKADEILAKARAALGGDKQIAKVQGASFLGTIGRSLGDRTVTGELTLDVQLPDKMLRTESISPMGDNVSVVQESGFNGDALLRFSKVLNAGPGMMIRTPPPPPAGSPEEAQQLRNSRAEFARLVTVLLMTAPKTLPIEFTYGGEAESPDGKADVIDMKGDGGFVAKLMLDKETHRPLVLTYRGVSPQMRVQTQTVTAGPGGPGGGRGRGDADHALPAAPPADLVDINMFFDDYKSVDGVMFPHHVARAVDGKTTEEWTFKTIKVNPAFKPDTFAKK